MVAMPLPDEGVMARRAEIAAALRRILPVANVIDAAPALRAYESDGLAAYRQPPLVVALPETTEQVSEVLRYAHANGIKIVPRGAGTSLSGGALPLADGILSAWRSSTACSRWTTPNRCAVVQPGVTNLAITRAVEHKGFYYAPDPPRRSPAPSAAMWRRIRAACIA